MKDNPLIKNFNIIKIQKGRSDQNFRKNKFH